MPPTLRAIPKVDRLLASTELAPLLERHPRSEVVEGVREVLDEVRTEMLAGTDSDVGSSGGSPNGPSPPTAG
jgi:hypothetical protein